MTIPRKDPLDKTAPDAPRVPARGVASQKLKENATDADSLKGKPISTNPPTAGQALVFDGEEYVPQPVPSGGGGGSGVTIEDEGANQGDATIINFTGAGVSATVAAGEATVTISGGGGGGHTIRENGTDQTARTGLNFVDADAGAGLITDDAGGDETEVNLSLYVLEAQHGGVSPTGHHAQSHDHSAAGDGTALVPASIDLTGILKLSGNVDVTWAAQQDDYDPSTNTIINVTLTGAQSLTGVSGGSDGRILIIQNVDGVDSLTIEDEHVSSAAANRFQLSGDIVLGPAEGAIFLYAASMPAPKWYCIGRYSADYFTVNFVIDGGGSVISTGVKGDVELPSAGVIEEWRLLADQSGNIDIQIWKDTYANFPPTVADQILNPTIVGATKNEATGLTQAVSSEDILRFNANGAATSITRCTVALKIRKT